MELNELLNYYNLTILNKPDECRNYTKMDLIDSDGYKYYLAKNNLTCAYERKSALNKFFRNPYTKYNFENYLKIHTNGDVVIKDFQNAQNAHDPILLYCYSANIEYNKNGNEIARGFYLLKQQMPNWKSPKRLEIEYIKQEAYKYNIEIVDDTYINNIAPIKFVCLKHKNMGIQEKPWKDIRTEKYPCKYCFLEFKKPKNKKDPEDLKEECYQKIAD